MLTNMDDHQLIAQFLTTDKQSAFNELVRRYQSPIRQFLRRLSAGDHALADDIAQETFLKMYSSLTSFRGEAKLSTWLHRIAYHCFLRANENNAKYQFSEEVKAPEPEALNNFEADSDIALEQLMKHLSVEERLMLTLNFSAGMSHGEIADVTHYPLGTIKSHIARGKHKLEMLLQAEEKQYA